MQRWFCSEQERRHFISSFSSRATLTNQPLTSSTSHLSHSHAHTLTHTQSVKSQLLIHLHAVECVRKLENPERTPENYQAERLHTGNRIDDRKPFSGCEKKSGATRRLTLLLFCLQMLETKMRPVGKHRLVSMWYSVRPLGGAAGGFRIDIEHLESEVLNLINLSKSLSRKSFHKYSIVGRSSAPPHPHPPPPWLSSDVTCKTIMGQRYWTMLILTHFVFRYKILHL